MNWSVFERVRRTLDRLAVLSEASGFLNLIKLLVYACLPSYLSWGVMGNEELGLIVLILLELNIGVIK